MIRETSKDETASCVRQASNEPDGNRSIDISGNVIDSRDLFITTREIIIGHGEDRYRLRLTSQNKLILTK
jgi:hemin uptake protein HemP